MFTKLVTEENSRPAHRYLLHYAHYYGMWVVMDTFTREHVFYFFRGIVNRKHHISICKRINAELNDNPQVRPIGSK